MDQEIEYLPQKSERLWATKRGELEKAGYVVRDLLPDQIEELMELGAYDKTLVPKTEDRLGVLIVFHKSKRALRVVPKKLFLRLLCSRNRNLIRVDEQKIFQSTTVAVAGLSVGSNICRVLTMQGGPQKLRIADADVLSTSNMNRVPANLFDVGDKKTLVLSRWLQSVNPYLEVESFDEGIDEENIERFTAGASVIFDEIDNLSLKLALRESAKKGKQPLVMITDNGDNVIVDIERYDLDSNLPPFHGLLSLSDIELIKNNTGKMTPQERVKLSLKIVQPQNAVPRMQESLTEVGRSLNTWPQLGTAASLAGVVGSYIVRKIALGESLVSGRHHISLDEKLIHKHRSLKNRYLRVKHTKRFIDTMRSGSK